MAAFDFSSSFSGLNSALGDIGKTIQANRQRQAQQEIGADLVNGDYKTAATKAFRFGDASTGLSLLKLGQSAEEKKQESEFLRGLTGGIVGGGTPSQNGVSGAPAASPVALGNPGEIENQFVEGVRTAGLTNPIGLGAVAAYGKAESGYSPGNINRQWNDPSTSGQPGMSGGIMSWREDRLRNLYKFAQGRGEQPGSISPATQAAFFASEDPTLIPRLNAAKTPQEANQIMANAWRFAGFDKPGGENARRLALTQAYAGRFGEQPTTVAAAPIPVINGGPVAPVQVAENEADVQRLEQEQAARQGQPAQPGTIPSGGTYAQSSPAELQAFLANPRVPEPMKIMMRQELASRGIGQGQAPVQVAQAAPQPGAPVSDVPAQGAREAQGFVIPGSGEVVPQSVGQDPKVQYWSRMMVAAPSDRARAAVKVQLDLALEDAKRNITQSQSRVRGLTDPQERLARGIPAEDTAPYQIDGNGRISAVGGSRTSVTVNNKGESKFDEALGAAQAKRWDGYIAAGDEARGRLADINTLRETSRRLGSQGSSANMKSLIGPYAESLGIKIEGLPDIQLYESITQRLAPQLRAPGSGSTSDIEFKGFVRAIGPLSNNPAAREMILDTFEAASRNEIARSEIASRLAAGDIKRSDAEKELRALPDPMTAFKEFRKANPDVYGAALKEAADTDKAQKANPPKATAAAPAAAVDHLRANPALRDAFDQKYGAGAAAKVLGQ